MTLRFGTDGVRGLANRALSPEFTLALGRAAARTLGAGTWGIGRDPRRSGPLLQAALTAGLVAEGARVVDLGSLPTPAVAHWSRVNEVPAAMISASHNAFADNGVKFFSAGGLKLDDDVQQRIEAELTTLLGRTAETVDEQTPTGAAVGEVRSEDAAATYVRHLVDEVLDGRRLDGMRVVLDAANGAASEVAAPVFSELGASVTVLHASPDGVNINDGCGSTAPDDLRRVVPAKRAHVGLAFDGDADRLVAVDEQGALVDGDALLGLFAIDRAEQGTLAGSSVVATVMSNLGLRRALEPRGITVVECGVGDRNVLATLERDGLTLGGEQSGHLIFRDLATTGDGILAGVLLLDVLARSGRPLSELAAVVEPVPQVLRNVRLAARRPDLLDRLADDVRAAEKILGDDGRVLVRLSGTEPLVRVMVEATDAAVADRVAGDLVAAAERVASGS